MQIFPHSFLNLVFTYSIMYLVIKNSIVSKFVSAFKKFCNKEYEHKIWQSRYYDHIIRNRNDYNEIWEYIENNPQKLLLTGKKQND